MVWGYLILTFSMQSKMFGPHSGTSAKASTDSVTIEMAIYKQTKSRPIP